MSEPSAEIIVCVVMFILSETLSAIPPKWVRANGLLSLCLDLVRGDCTRRID
jgi:hypothetical protein